MSAIQRETGTPELLSSLDGGVLTITLNRPEARNAMTQAMVDALAAELARAEFDDAVRCLVLTGAGKGFCAGGDVKAMSEQKGSSPADLSLDVAIHRQRHAQRETAGRLFRMPKPVIAAINGAAAGAGLSLALACDLRVMSSAAVLATAFGQVGLSGDFGGTWLMSQLVGSAKARELYFLSSRVSAEEALAIGLANFVCPSEALEARVAEIAHRLASGPGVAFRYMKENLNRSLGGEFEDVMDLEATHHIHCGRTADHREAASAFVEKRPPVFLGH